MADAVRCTASTILSDKTTLVVYTIGADAAEIKHNSLGFHRYNTLYIVILRNRDYKSDPRIVKMSR